MADVSAPPSPAPPASPSGVLPRAADDSPPGMASRHSAAFEQSAAAQPQTYSSMPKRRKTIREKPLDDPGNFATKIVGSFNNKTKNAVDSAAQKLSFAACLAFVSPFIVEFTGTLFLTLTAASTVDSPVAPVAIGGILTAMIFMGGHISGGHYNPAVTAAVCIRGKIGFVRGVGYWVVQVIGGLCAARIADVSGNLTLPLPAPGDGVSDGYAFLYEFLYTYALAATVLNVATTVSQDGNHYFGLAIGLVVTAGSAAAGPVSGAAFNPAVASGLFAVANTTDKLWIYWIGPLAGGIVAGIMFHVINSSENELRFGYTSGVARAAAAVGGQTEDLTIEVDDVDAFQTARAKKNDDVNGADNV